MAASTPTLTSESRVMRRFYHKSGNFTCYPGKPTRVGVRYLDDGSKQRYCKKCGSTIGQIAPPRAAYAKK